MHELHLVFKPPTPCTRSWCVDSLSVHVVLYTQYLDCGISSSTFYLLSVVQFTSLMSYVKVRRLKGSGCSSSKQAACCAGPVDCVLLSHDAFVTGCVWDFFFFFLGRFVRSGVTDTLLVTTRCLQSGAIFWYDRVPRLSLQSKVHCSLHTVAGVTKQLNSNVRIPWDGLFLPCACTLSTSKPSSFTGQPRPPREGGPCGVDST